MGIRDVARCSSLRDIGARAVCVVGEHAVHKALHLGLNGPGRLVLIGSDEASDLRVAAAVVVYLDAEVIGLREVDVLSAIVHDLLHQATRRSVRGTRPCVLDLPELEVEIHVRSIDHGVGREGVVRDMGDEVARVIRNVNLRLTAPGTEDD